MITADLQAWAAAALAPLLAHLWSSTLFLLLMLLVLGTMRNRLTASSRFFVALTGIIKFAFPGALVMRGIQALTPFLFKAHPDSALDLPFKLLGGNFSLNGPVVIQAEWPAAILLLWGTVAAALILRSRINRQRLVTLALRTALPPSDRETAALQRARLRAAIPGSIDLARSSLPEAPAVLRIFRPLIVLPSKGCEELSDEELESLLRHECAHVTRHDNLLARVEGVICALFWFHPLLWITQRITRLERERACDEAVARSAQERATYLAALKKYCHEAIAPRLPGVSCMATTELMERIEHMMNFERVKAHAPALHRVVTLSIAFLLLFTAVSGLVGSEPAFARDTQRQPYAIRFLASRSGDLITVHGRVSDNATAEVLSEPSISFPVGESAQANTSSGEVKIAIDLHADTAGRIQADVTISRQNKVLQTDEFTLTPSTMEQGPASKYNGEPIELSLKDADLRDVIKTFGQLTGLQMQVDDGIEGKVTVDWRNVPWDEAFDSMIKEQGLKYEITARVVHIMKR